MIANILTVVKESDNSVNKGDFESGAPTFYTSVPLTWGWECEGGGVLVIDFIFHHTSPTAVKALKLNSFEGIKLNIKSDLGSFVFTEVAPHPQQ